MRAGKSRSASQALMLGILFFYLGTVAFDPPVQARRAIPDDNLGYPVLVSAGDEPIGSGFFVNSPSASYFVTARHVLFTVDSAQPVAQIVELTSYGRDPADDAQNHLSLNLPILVDRKLLRFHRMFDVAVALIGRAEQSNDTRIVTFVEGVTGKSQAKSGIVGVAITNIKKLSDVLVSNEAYVFGFPSSIGLRKSPRFDYDRPLLREGIISGKSERLQSIVLDAAVYKGNSGGPVLEVEQEGLGHRFWLIGVITEFVPYVEEWLNRQHGHSNVQISNSGYAVAAPGDAVLELVSSFEASEGAR